MSVESVTSAFPFATPPGLDHDPEADRLREEAPVVRAQLPDGAIVWLATRHAAVRQVLSDARFSRAASVVPGAPSLVPGTQLPDMLTSLDPPRHTRVRRLVAGAFTPRVTESRRPRIRDIAAALLERLAEEGAPADLVAGFTVPLPIEVICDLLGIPADDVRWFRRWVDPVLSIGAYTPEEVRDAQVELGVFLAGLVETKRRQPGDDVMTQLIEAHDEDDRLSAPELIMFTQLLIAAGHDTLASQLANSLLTLFEHPDQLELLRAQPELLPSAVEELLRFTRLMPATLPRVATEDIDVGGVTVPAGATVFPLQYSANRDTGATPDAHRLDVTRPATNHLAFGAGPHTCLGASLARAELEVALSELLGRFPDLRLAVPAARVEWKAGIFIRGVKALPVTW